MAGDMSLQDRLTSKYRNRPYYRQSTQLDDYLSCIDNLTIVLGVGLTRRKSKEITKSRERNVSGD